MRQRAAELVNAGPEALAWFRYGASYATSLFKMARFYRLANRDDEADDVTVDLESKCAGAVDIDTVVKNFLRLGIYFDEVSQARTLSGKDLIDNDEIEELLTKIRG
jgi:hypothetical protein